MTKTPSGLAYATALSEVAFLLAAHPELTVPHSIDVTVSDWSEQPIVNVSIPQGANRAESEENVRPWAQLVNTGNYEVSEHEPDTPKFWTWVGFHGVVFGGLFISAYACHRHAQDRNEAREPAAVAM